MHDYYRDAIEYMREEGYQEISGFDLYNDLFPDNELSGEFNADYSKPNAIYLYYDSELGKLRRRIMLKDTWEIDYESFIDENRLTLCSGLSYRKRANKLANAQRMHALIFDIDGVGASEIKTMCLRWNVEPEHIRSIPKPTYLALSGSGVHLYYVFDEPIDLYPNIKIMLKSLKYDLTFRIWEYKATSQVKQIQYQSINQSFRMVGSINSKYNTVVRAFKVGERVSVELLNKYVQESSRVDLNKPFKPTQVTVSEAREKYPDWYERVIVQGQKKPKKWDIADKVNGDDRYALYHWWISQSDKIVGGHRYFFLMCMSIYACKCDVPKKQLKKDMLEIFDKLASIEHSNPLTMNDIQSALESYDKEYYDTSIKEIEYWTDIRIERNKRNGRSQENHLKRARAVQLIDYPNGEWREGNGRKSKRAVVQEWRSNNPSGTKAECVRDTKLSKPTVYKHW